MQNIDDIRKITRGYQFTLPKDFRNINSIKEGDFISVKLIGNSLVLDPVVIKRRNAIKRLDNIFANNSKDKFWDDKTEDEVMKIVDIEIKVNRKRKKKK